MAYAIRSIAFGPGDYGPSGEDVRQRFVFAGTWHAPGGFEVSGLSQAESARPFTITTADNRGRIAINGVPTALDQFRGTPYIQTDLRVSRPLSLGKGGRSRHSSNSSISSIATIRAQIM